MKAVVAPLAGAWIETLMTLTRIAQIQPVAPLAGAWIETRTKRRCLTRLSSRAPRGRVD